MRLRATRRLAWLVIGFATIFVPTRIVIAISCTDGRCYAANRIALDGDVGKEFLHRFLTGFPPAGWRIVPSEALGVRYLLTNVVMGFIVVTLIAVVTRAPTEPFVAERGTASYRLATGCIGLGLSVVVLGSLLASLSEAVQLRNLRVGASWRETLLTSMGWAIIVIGLLVFLVTIPKGRKRKLVPILVSSVLACALVMTLLTNARLAHTDNLSFEGQLLNRIAASSIGFDPTDAGNMHRCLLIGQYLELRPDRAPNVSGPRLAEDLDNLFLPRYGVPYCHHE
ncbi:hypothetical protein OAM92_01465 [Acidimicrobiales bacterium]|nr:hypothetical protein [Acidimicrobiales bacterium]